MSPHPVWDVVEDALGPVGALHVLVALLAHGPDAVLAQLDRAIELREQMPPGALFRALAQQAPEQAWKPWKQAREQAKQAQKQATRRPRRRRAR